LIPKDDNVNLIDFYLPDLRLSLQCLVLAVGGEYIPVFGGNITMPSIVYGMKIVAQNVQTIIVPNSGHWIPEEQPVFVVKLLNNFFSGKPTETSK
jgi:pimeloyl-ACP methyl ester carboxylesterase